MINYVDLAGEAAIIVESFIKTNLDWPVMDARRARLRVRLSRLFIRSGMDDQEAKKAAREVQERAASAGSALSPEDIALVIQRVVSEDKVKDDRMDPPAGITEVIAFLDALPEMVLPSGGVVRTPQEAKTVLQRYLS